MLARSIRDWLLEDAQPAMQFRTLSELMGRPPSDPKVRASRRRLTDTGWAKEILAARAPWGGWESPRGFYTPKYLSTNWRMIVLADLGLTREDPMIADLCERWMAAFPLEGGGYGGNSKGNGHHCVVGNMARSLIRLGYADDPRTRVTLEWLVSTADPQGGWSCFGTGRNLDSWEGLSAFAVYPRAKWTRGMTDVVEQGAEFFLDRQLHRQGSRYPPWFLIHYPNHYYYDLLVGLDVLTALGYHNDPRLAFALDWLEKKRRPDGRWNLDAVYANRRSSSQPGPVTMAKDTGRNFALENPGQASKLVTLRALTVLDRAGC